LKVVLGFGFLVVAAVSRFGVVTGFRVVAAVGRFVVVAALRVFVVVCGSPLLVGVVDLYGRTS
jgi:hypothetical protein